MTNSEKDEQDSLSPAESKSSGFVLGGHKMEETLLWFGGEVKALDDQGRVGGYLVRFTDADNRDLTGEYFTAKTYLGPNEGNGVESLFDHGFPIEPIAPDSINEATLKAIRELAEHTFSPLKTKRDDIGVWAEIVLDIADDYEKAVFGMVKKGKLGWSSGAASHRVKKADDGQILKWPIAEGSLTPRPAEPLNRAISLKSLGTVKFVSLSDAEGDDPPLPVLPRTSLAAKLRQLIEDRVDDGVTRESLVKTLAREAAIEISEVESVLNGHTPRPSDARLKAFARVFQVDFEALRETAHGMSPQTIKGMFEDALADRTPSRWELDSAFCDVVRKLANVAASTILTGVEFDLVAKVHEAVLEYMARLESMVINQITEYVESGSDEQFYLKTIIDLSSDLPVSGTLHLDDHSQLAVSVLREVTKRFRANHESRTKSGRVLSEKNRNRIAEKLKDLQSIFDDLNSLLAESQPMASDTEKRLAQTNFLRLQGRTRQLGVV